MHTLIQPSVYFMTIKGIKVRKFNKNWRKHNVRICTLCLFYSVMLRCCTCMTLRFQWNIGTSKYFCIDDLNMILTKLFENWEIATDSSSDSGAPIQQLSKGSIKRSSQFLQHCGVYLRDQTEKYKLTSCNMLCGNSLMT